MKEEDRRNLNGTYGLKYWLRKDYYEPYIFGGIYDKDTKTYNEENLYEFAKAITKLDFSEGSSDIYSEETNQKAFMYRFGLTYFLDYYLITKSVLNDFVNVEETAPEKFGGMLSLGCGAAIDCFSLAYAKESFWDTGVDPNKRSKSLELGSYIGYDLNDWNNSSLVNEGRQEKFKFDTAYDEIKCYYGNENGNILNAFGPGKEINQSIILFAKVIELISDDDWKTLTKNIEATVFKQNTLYLCTNLATSGISKSCERIEELCKILKEKHGYNKINKNVLDNIQGELKDNSLCRNQNDNYYYFEDTNQLFKYACSIYEQTGLKNDLINILVNEWPEALYKMLENRVNNNPDDTEAKKLMDKLSPSENTPFFYKQPLANLNYKKYQVIKLKRQS